MVTANSIRPAIIRGSLYWFIGDVGFSSLKGAICAWMAAEVHRLDIVDVAGGVP